VKGAASGARRGYVLVLLSGVYFFYQLDRNALLVTQELVKHEFGLSDTQLGLLSGLLYGVSYGLAGLPLGYLVGRIDRRRLLALIVALWSGMTMLSGLAARYWQLAAARLVVGAAESGGTPAALSILSDLYPPQRRAAITSLFYAGGGLGGMVTFLGGGAIAAHWGWRAVFLIYGLPGLVLALLIATTTRDPPRRSLPVQAPLHPARAILILLGDPALLAVLVGSTLFTLSMAGFGSWMIPYFMRVQHLTIAQAGIAVALGLSLLSMAGTILFGFIADAGERRWRGGLLLLLAFATLLNGLTGIGVALSAALVPALICFAIWGATSLVCAGCANAAIAELAPDHARGLGFALYAVLCNLLGAGLGPLFSGMISDAFQPTLGDGSIRPAIGALAAVQLLATLAFVRAALLWRIRRAAA